MPSTLATSVGPAARTSLFDKCLGVFASPGEQFDEVIAAPVSFANWRIPTLLVCLAGIAALQITTQSTTIPDVATGGLLSPAELQALAGVWPLVLAAAVCLGAIAGSLWSACVLWCMGRVFLGARFSFFKTLEIVGLTGVVLALGTVVSSLLITVTGDDAARPALSLLAGKASLSPSARQILEALDFFQIWSTTVLAIGLSRLSGASFKESAFWVFGYWFVFRIALIILQ